MKEVKSFPVRWEEIEENSRKFIERIAK